MNGKKEEVLYYGQAVFSLSGSGKKIVLSLRHYFFGLKHLHRFTYIKSESIHWNSSKSFFILGWSFSISL